MPAFQFVRAVAALLVVYFHSVLQLDLLLDASPAQMGTEALFPLFGKRGVDVFFVLSGVLMWRTTASGRLQIGQFYAKRILRIVPLYWTVTIFTALVAVLAPGLLKSTQLDPAHLIASLFFIPWPSPGRVGGDLYTPLVVPGWTLNFEVFFYALFGLSLLVPRPYRLQACVGLFAAAVAIVTTTRDASAMIAFYTPDLIWEFVIGLVLGVVLERGMLLPAWPAWILLGIATTALCWFDAVPADTERLVSAALPAFVILFAAASLDLRGRWPKLPWLTRLGDASFSLYLTHVFVVATVRAALVHLEVPFGDVSLQIGYVLGSVLLSCLLSLVVYKTVERPLGAKLWWLYGRATGAHSPASERSVGAASRRRSVASDARRSSSVSG